MRLAKEDSMVDDRPILTANSHGDNIFCNRSATQKGNSA